MALTTWLLFEVLVLLGTANAAPVLATRLLEGRGAWPLDGGLLAWDGRPLFGTSKTVRGLVAALAATAVCAALLGLGWRFGVLFGAASMAGDLFSSFVKRRLGVPSSGQAMGLDQIPEALFPLLICYSWLGLDVLSVVVLVAVFTAAQIAVSPAMYRLGIRRKPY